MSLLLGCSAAVFAAIIVLTVSTRLATLRRYRIQSHHPGEVATLQHALARNGIHSNGTHSNLRLVFAADKLLAEGLRSRMPTKRKVNMFPLTGKTRRV